MVTWTHEKQKITGQGCCQAKLLWIDFGQELEEISPLQVTLG